jgi:glucarate dehydratase
VSRIARVEAWPVNVPLEAAYEMAPGIVAGIHRTIVRVTTEDGVVGLGETPSPHDADSLRARTDDLVGRDTDALRAELGAAPLPRPSHRGDGRVVIDEPLTGIEIALWDIAAREAGLPLYELFGGLHRAQVGFSEYFAYRHGGEQTPAEVAAYCARMAEEHGSTIFEGKVGVRSADDDLGLAREVRAAIGARSTLRLDANMGWSVETAGRVLPRLEPYDIANVEEPVASFDEMAALRRTTAIPFSAHTPDVARAAELRAPDTLVIGLGPCGGIAGTRRFISACEEARVRFWFYSGDLGVATAAYLHLGASTPYLDQPSQSLLRWTTEDVVVGGPFVPKDDVVPVPTGPGLGVELDEGALERCVERYALEGPYDYYGGPSLPRY